MLPWNVCGFFSSKQKMIAPPRELPPQAGRVRFTTEEYMNSLYVPEVDKNIPGVRFTQTAAMAFTQTAQAHLVTMPFDDGTRIQTIQRVVMGGVME